MHTTQLDYLAAARFSGKDAGGFLHAQLSADVQALAPGQATFAAYCSPRGQVLGVLLVCRRHDGYLAAASAALLTGILQRLQLFVLRSQVDFAEAPEMAVLGVAAEAAVAPGLESFMPGEHGLRYAFGPPGTAQAAAARRWKQHELERGLVWLSPVSAEKYIPQMLGLDGLGAVSFDKGCYPGQEIVARARYLGKVKRGPVRLRVAQELDPAVGSRVGLLAGDDAAEGTLVDCAAADQSTLLFVVAPNSHAAGVDAIEVDGARYRCATI